MKTTSDTDFSQAIERSLKIRAIYNQLELLHHGSAWTNGEDMIGLVSDVGELGRMVMAADGRWLYQGDLNTDLPDKLAECLWWIFVLSDRLGINLTSAFSAKMAELEASLGTSLERTGGQS
ncbi:MAG: hypothetical protein WCK77_01675 [Verrucomicrobiota bacterium]